MAVPKRKKSKSKIRMRHAAHRAKIKRSEVGACSQCGAPKQTHRVCPSCGYYRGRQVVTVEAD